jgi:hypothetical protein
MARHFLRCSRVASGRDFSKSNGSTSIVFRASGRRNINATLRWGEIRPRVARERSDKFCGKAVAIAPATLDKYWNRHHPHSYK